MKAFHIVTSFAFLACFCAAAVVAGCDSSSGDAPHDTPKDSGAADTGTADGGNPMNDGSTGDGATDSGPPSCYTNPRTHYEIINACTDAQSFDKNPRLPLLQPDGSLPPLP
jgi:hypothetical protein